MPDRREHVSHHTHTGALTSAPTGPRGVVDQPLVALGIGMIALSAAVTGLGPLQARVPLFLLLNSALFACYVAAITRLRRPAGTARSALIVIVSVAILCRVILLAGPPSLSDDVFRYSWDGRVQQAGIDPYRYPPNHPALDVLRTPEDAAINHPALETIYPPLAQWVFRTAAAVAPTVFAQKAAFTLFDLATIGAVIALLRRRDRHPAWCLIYAWNPLVLIEFAHSGHLDSLAICWLIVALWALADQRPAQGLVALALSALAKYFAVLFLPYAVFRPQLRRWVPLFLTLIALGYAAFMDSPRAWFASLGVYAVQWEFNSATFTLLNPLIGNGAWTRTALLAALVAWSIYHAARGQDPVRYAYLVIGFALLFSPTLHPWYVCWIVPFLCVYPSRAWIALTGLVPLSYWAWVDAQAGGAWTVRPEILVLEYAPFYALLSWETWRVPAKRVAVAA